MWIKKLIRDLFCAKIIFFILISGLGIETI